MAKALEGLAALAFALRVEPAELLDISFNAAPEPVLNLFRLGRNCVSARGALDTR
jgi:hypothetical protein